MQLRFKQLTLWWTKHRIFTAAPLGSIPELPAMSCLEIKVSEGKNTISGKYWLDPTGAGKAILIYCDMVSGGRSYHFLYKLFLPQNYININFISITTICLVSISFSVNTLLTSFYHSHCLHFKFLDMDECKYNINECDLNANCTNTYGSYKCTCKAGYTGDGHSCSGTFNFHYPRWP